MAPYLHECGGDQAKALRLYQWNVLVSGALYEALALAEVVLRNAIHDELTAWHTRQELPGTWLDAPRNLLEKRARIDIATAYERAARGRRPAGDSGRNTRPNSPVGAIVAELNFGFWRFLPAARYEHTLWRDAIRHGFPGARGDRTRIERPVRRLHQVRNRIAHLEPVFARDLLNDEQDIDRVLRSVCHDTAQWAAKLRRVKGIVAARP